MRYMLARQRNRLACLGVTTQPGWSKMQRKTAETTNLYAFALRQSVAHKLQKVLNSQLHIFRWKMLLLAGNRFDKFRFRHFSACV